MIKLSLKVFLSLFGGFNGANVAVLKTRAGLQFSLFWAAHPQLSSNLFLALLFNTSLLIEQTFTLMFSLDPPPPILKLASWQADPLRRTQRFLTAS